MKCNQSLAKNATLFNANQHNRHANSRPPARAHHSRSSSRSMWVNNPVQQSRCQHHHHEHDGDDQNHKVLADHRMPVARFRTSRPPTRSAHSASSKAASAATITGATNDQTSLPQSTCPLPSCLRKGFGNCSAIVLPKQAGANRRHGQGRKGGVDHQPQGEMRDRPPAQSVANVSPCGSLTDQPGAQQNRHGEEPKLDRGATLRLRIGCPQLIRRSRHSPNRSRGCNHDTQDGEGHHHHEPGSAGMCALKRPAVREVIEELGQTEQRHDDRHQNQPVQDHVAHHDRQQRQGVEREAEVWREIAGVLAQVADGLRLRIARGRSCGRQLVDDLMVVASLRPSHQPTANVAPAGNRGQVVQRIHERLCLLGGTPRAG